MPITPAEQLAATLREDIRTGRLRPGDELPRDRELVARHQISHSTVARAIDTLRAEGLVAGRVGSGRSVIDHPPPQRVYRAAPTPPPPDAERATEPADRPTALALGITQGEDVTIRTWLDTTDSGTPLALRAIRTAVDQAAADVVPTQVEEVVTARLATTEEAETLRIDQTIPVLVIRRSTRDAAGQLSIEDTIAASHRLELLYTLPT